MAHRDSYHLFLALSLPVWPERTRAHRALATTERGLCSDPHALNRNMWANHTYIESALHGEIAALAIATDAPTLTATVQYE